ncbi:MAG: molybdopterin-dependent oxidoreductase [Gemmatimonadaceae bacterium]|nr:molybdopterin-dependent oxidoreductase [Acetobacteraceae bacterium]
MRRLMQAAALLTLLGAAPSLAQDISVSGQVERPSTLSVDALRALPAVTLDVAHLTSRGMQRATYTGAQLWAVVGAAGLVEPTGRERLQRVVMAQGRDGYAVALAIGELHPDFAGKQVLVAYAQDGQALPALRLIVPGDLHAGRNVRDLVSIEVR